jgi:hypothetical protein
VVRQFHTVRSTLAAHLDDKRGTRCSRERTQIEVTPEMIEAGMRVALDVTDEWESLAAPRAAEIISDVYTAMRLACDGQV